MLDFIVVGAAQAGLAMAYYLKEQGKDFLIVDKESEVGASWLNRWDSLTLFTPSEFNNMPGMEFPA
ncbi:MAG: NAD(P)-binding domain-containing protein, partial [Christiangramia sp.]